MTNTDIKQLNTRFDELTIRFDELIDFLGQKFDAIDFKLMKLDILENRVDHIFEEILSMRQEKSITDHRTLTMEKWIINAAKKLNYLTNRNP